MRIVTYPHGPLRALADNLWLVEAPTSMGAMDRKMTVARGDDGRLFLFDALWLDDATFAQLDALGPVGVIFVPNWLHDFDGEALQQRYPTARLCAFPATSRRLGWTHLEEFTPAMAPAPITLRTLPGVRSSEAVCEVRHPDGTATQIYCDALFHVPHGGGVSGSIMRLIGSTGQFHMSPLARWLLLRDKAAFRGWLESQAVRPDLCRIICGHGLTLEADIPAQLRAAAARL